MAHEVKIVYTAEDKASGKTATINDKLGEMQKQLVAAAAVAMTFKKAFDFSYEGAQFIQTGESFDMLMDKVGAAPTTWDELKRAAGGTISEMKLMSSTATLLAGASGELATGLANATPELMEIARAANKLNPSLGDTTYMYNSLATGIKRASPLILDNLGIVVKVGEANAAWATKLGKTVEELTAAEQKQALLNGTLEAGRVLIEQVGGNTDSMTDAWTRMTAKIENATNAIKGWLAEGLMPWLELGAGGKLNIDDALEAHQKVVMSTAGTYKDFVYQMYEAYDVAGKTKYQDEWGYSNAEMVAELSGVTEGIFAARGATDGWANSLDSLMRQTSDQRYGIEGVTDGWMAYAGATEEATAATESSSRANDLNVGSLGNVTQRLYDQGVAA